MYLGSDYYGVTNTPLAQTIEAEVPEVEVATKIGFPRNIWLGQGEKGFYVRAVYADENFFKVFSFKLIEGNGETSLAGPNRILLSREVSERYFKGESPLGKTILNDLLITGVFENTEENSHLQMDCVIPFVNLFPLEQRERVLADWDNTSFFTYVKLRREAIPCMSGAKSATLSTNTIKPTRTNWPSCSRFPKFI